jgi:two-component system sensor histidine kinase QseC
LSRLDSLAQLDDVHTIAIDELLQSSVMEMYHSAQQAGIELRLHLNATQVMQPGQPLLLSLLVRNLLDNAVRYSPRGSQVDITLDAREFSVRDNGPGVSPERWRVSASASIALPARMSPVAGWDYLSSAALPRCTG